VSGITVIGRPKSVQIGGFEATQLDVQSGERNVTFAPIQGVKEPSAVGFSPRQTHRIIVLRVGGKAVMIMVGVVTDPDDAGVTPDELRAATEALQPLIDSIAWH
jgi:hypothetical protein